MMYGKSLTDMAIDIRSRLDGGRLKEESNTGAGARHEPLGVTPWARAHAGRLLSREAVVAVARARALTLCVLPRPGNKTPTISYSRKLGSFKTHSKHILVNISR